MSFVSVGDMFTSEEPPLKRVYASSVLNKQNNITTILYLCQHDLQRLRSKVFFFAYQILRRTFFVFNKEKGKGLKTEKIKVYPLYPVLSIANIYPVVSTSNS